MGKSTLFNRLVGMRQAIVDETAGVTRDRHYGKCEWCGHEFSVVDTGGYTSDSDDIFEDEIRKQVAIAVEECDLVLFMVEADTGITDYDDEIAALWGKGQSVAVEAFQRGGDATPYVSGKFVIASLEGSQRHELRTWHRHGGKIILQAECDNIGNISCQSCAVHAILHAVVRFYG